jgi:hypothetical protein
MSGYWPYATHKKHFFFVKKHQKHESQSVKTNHTHPFQNL